MSYASDTITPFGLSTGRVFIIIAAEVKIDINYYFCCYCLCDFCVTGYFVMLFFCFFYLKFILCCLALLESLLYCIGILLTQAQSALADKAHLHHYFHESFSILSCSGEIQKRKM